MVGLEGRPQNVERAEFLKGLFGANNVAFYVTNLEEDRLPSYGKFDAVFCCGLLYHLANPRVFAERAAAVSPNLYLDMQYARLDWKLTERDGLRGWVRTEDPKILRAVSPARPSGPPWTNFTGSSRRAATEP